MQYTLAGFTHDRGVRVFAFIGSCDGKEKTEYRVRADIGLIKRYGIRVQELPLLCMGLLERRNEDDDRRTFTYTEADMRGHAESCAARDAQTEKKKVRRPPAQPGRGGWHDRYAVRLGPASPQ